MRGGEDRVEGVEGNIILSYTAFYRSLRFNMYLQNNCLIPYMGLSNQLRPRGGGYQGCSPPPVVFSRLPLFLVTKLHFRECLKKIFCLKLIK